MRSNLIFLDSEQADGLFLMRRNRLGSQPIPTRSCRVKMGSDAQTKQLTEEQGTIVTFNDEKSAVAWIKSNGDHTNVYIIRNRSGIQLIIGKGLVGEKSHAKIILADTKSAQQKTLGDVVIVTEFHHNNRIGLILWINPLRGFFESPSILPSVKWTIKEVFQIGNISFRIIIFLINK